MICNEHSNVEAPQASILPIKMNQNLSAVNLSISYSKSIVSTCRCMQRTCQTTMSINENSMVFYSLSCFPQHATLGKYHSILKQQLHFSVPEHRICLYSLLKQI